MAATCLQGSRVSMETLRQLESTLMDTADLYSPAPAQYQQRLMADPSLSAEARLVLLGALGFHAEDSSKALQGSRPGSARFREQQQPCQQGFHEELPSVSPPAAAEQLLVAALGEWQLDIFELEAATMGNALSTLVCWLLQHEGLVQRLQLDSCKLQQFMQQVQDG